MEKINLEKSFTVLLHYRNRLAGMFGGGAA